MSRQETFDNFLAEQHDKQYLGFKDKVIEDYEKWLDDLDIDDWIKLGEQFRNRMNSHWVREINGVGKILSTIKHLGVANRGNANLIHLWDFEIEEVLISILTHSNKKGKR
jgi:hypothetical protein